MAEKTRNLCAEIPLELHTKVRQRQAESGETLSRYMTALITKFYEMEENVKMNKENVRTVAFQVPTELFERFKAYLKRNGIKQNAFFLDCIHRALAEAQEERVDAEADTNTGDGTHLPEEAYTPEDDAEPEGEPDGNEGVEESSTEE